MPALDSRLCDTTSAVSADRNFRALGHRIWSFGLEYYFCSLTGITGAMTAPLSTFVCLFLLVVKGERGVNISRILRVT